MTGMDDWHGWLALMTGMDDWHGWQGWMTGMDDRDGWLEWMTGMDDWHWWLAWMTGTDDWHGLILHIDYRQTDRRTNGRTLLVLKSLSRLKKFKIFIFIFKPNFFKIYDEILKISEIFQIFIFKSVLCERGFLFLYFFQFYVKSNHFFSFIIIELDLIAVTV